MLMELLRTPETRPGTSRGTRRRGLFASRSRLRSPPCGRTDRRARLLGTALAALSAAAACKHGDGPQPQEITVGELATLLKSDRRPHIYDANGKTTRAEYGVIPGAILLPSSDDYSLRLLPSDKAEKLVFYCASSWCGAAEHAAGRAMEAGYAWVAVLPDGIKGWVKAGMAVARAE